MKQKELTFIGVDPGLDGAIAIIDGDLITIKVMPTIIIKKGKKNKRTISHKGIKEIFEVIKGESYAIIEKQHAMPGQGVVSMLTIGIGYGSLLQILVDFEVPFEEVRAQEWQKEFGIGKGNTKEQALDVCQRLFPNLSLLPNRRYKKPHDGVVDALLIAEYNRRRFHLNER